MNQSATKNVDQLCGGQKRKEGGWVVGWGWGGEVGPSTKKGMWGQGGKGSGVVNNGTRSF